MTRTETLNQLKISLAALLALGLSGVVFARLACHDLHLAFVFSISAPASAGFTLAAAVYALNLRQMRPWLRPALLTGWLGYALILPSVLINAERTRRMAQFWQPNSPLMETAACFLLCAALLGVESAPRPIRCSLVIPLTALGVIAALLQQCTLGALYGMSANALDALHWTWRLPVFVYFSAISIGLALPVCLQVWRRQPEQSELAALTRTAQGAVGLACFHFIVCLGALALTHDVYAILPNPKFYLPIGLGIALPASLLNKPGRKFLLVALLMLLLSLLFSRLDATLLGLDV